MITIPTGNEYKQPNDSDITGDVYSSYNLDFTENIGRMRLGTRMLLGLNNTAVPAWTNLTVAFREFNTSFGNQIIGLAEGFLMASIADYPGSGFAAYGGSRPTDLTAFNSDMEIFQSDLYMTGATNLYKLAFGTTNVSTTLYSSLGTASQHKMCTFGARLYITNNDNQIYSWDGSAMTTTGANSLTLGTPAKNNIAWIKAGSNRIWIGFNSNINSAGSRGVIYEWDGAATTPTKIYQLDTPGTYGCVMKDDVPWVMDAYGRLMAWNGGTFKEMARLNRRKNVLFNMSELSALVHSNGMALINGRINMLVNGTHFDSTASSEDTIPSGIWEYDDTVGLYHKHSFGLSAAAGAITDWGTQRLINVGALQECNYPDASANRNGTFVAGVQYPLDATTSAQGVFSDDSNDTLQKAGTYISPKIDSQNITDNWNKLFLTYKKFLDAADKITFKYRIVETAATQFTGTWSSSDAVSTTFTTSTSLSAYWTSGTGGEVEVLSGVASGRTAHITNIQVIGSSTFITLDESFPGTNSSSTTFIGKAGMWTKITSQLPMTFDWSEFPIGVTTGTTWIQLKMSMLFTGKDEIHKIVLINKPQQLAS